MSDGNVDVVVLSQNGNRMELLGKCTVGNGVFDLTMPRPAGPTSVAAYSRQVEPSVFAVRESGGDLAVRIEGPYSRWEGSVIRDFSKLVGIDSGKVEEVRAGYIMFDVPAPGGVPRFVLTEIFDASRGPTFLRIPAKGLVSLRALGRSGMESGALLCPSQDVPENLERLDCEPMLRFMLYASTDNTKLGLDGVRAFFLDLHGSWRELEGKAISGDWVCHVPRAAKSLRVCKPGYRAVRLSDDGLGLYGDRIARLWLRRDAPSGTAQMVVAPWIAWAMPAEGISSMARAFPAEGGLYGVSGALAGRHLGLVYDQQWDGLKNSKLMAGNYEVSLRGPLRRSATVPVEMSDGEDLVLYVRQELWSGISVFDYVPGGGLRDVIDLRITCPTGDDGAVDYVKDPEDSSSVLGSGTSLSGVENSGTLIVPPGENTVEIASGDPPWRAYRVHCLPGVITILDSRTSSR